MPPISLQESRLAQIQGIINTILEFSLQPLTLEAQLTRTLDLILSLEWLIQDAKGAIFLTEPDHRSLIMTVQRNMPPALVSSCHRVDFNHCLCGRAAATGKAVYSDAVDDHHETAYDGMSSHGHYCVPIKYGQQVLGVINLYVPGGQTRNEIDDRFLGAIANALAGLIVRKQAEDELRQARHEMERIISGQTSKEIFNQQVIQEVFDYWNQERDSHNWPPPQGRHVARILETVFMASLRKKEEKPTRISVSLLESPALVDEIGAYDSMLLRFSSMLPFTSDTLATIAPSFDPGTTSLLVVPGDGPDSELKIMGAIFFTQRGLHRFDAMTYALTPLDIFSVTAKKPGHLVLFRGNEIIGIFLSGRLSDPMPTTFTKSPMAWNMLNVIQEHPEYRRHGSPYWDIYLDMVDRILLEGMRRGHGGIFLWVPAEAEETARKLIKNRFPLAQSPEGAALLDRFLALEKPSTSNRPNPLRQTDLFNCKRELIELVELISQLSCMDGAVILSDRLHPICFGAMISCPPWQGQVISWRPNDDLFPTVALDQSGYGARHNATLNFVGQCPGSIGFVISQDGPIAGLTMKDAETIYWWPDCLSRLCDI